MIKDLKEDAHKQVKVSNPEENIGKKDEEIISMEEKVSDMGELSKETEI